MGGTMIKMAQVYMEYNGDVYKLTRGAGPECVLAQGIGCMECKMKTDGRFPCTGGNNLGTAFGRDIGEFTMIWEMFHEGL